MSARVLVARDRAAITRAVEKSAALHADRGGLCISCKRGWPCPAVAIAADVVPYVRAVA